MWVFFSPPLLSSPQYGEEKYIQTLLLLTKFAVCPFVLVNVDENGICSVKDGGLHQFGQGNFFSSANAPYKNYFLTFLVSGFHL